MTTENLGAVRAGVNDFEAKMELRGIPIELRPALHRYNEFVRDLPRNGDGHAVFTAPDGEVFVIGGVNDWGAAKAERFVAITKPLWNEVRAGARACRDAAVDEAETEIRQFVTIISEQAKRAIGDKAQAGSLSLSRLSPHGGGIVPSRFKIDDIEQMVKCAIGDAKAGHNSYIEARTVLGVKHGKRGDDDKTGYVFALVLDCDADKGEAGNVPEGATLIVESSTGTGNSQQWFFLREAVTADDAAPIGELIRATSGTDKGATGKSSQPFRIAGTLNYPDAKKRARGRVLSATRILEHHPERMWTLAGLRELFGNVKPKAETKATPDANETKGSNSGDESTLPAALLDTIKNGVDESADRSRVFFGAVAKLKRLKWSFDDMVELFERYPNGIALKYVGRVRVEVERDYEKIQTDEHKAKEPTPPQLLAYSFDSEQDLEFPMCLIEDIATEGTVGLLAGESTAGKSFVAIDLGFAINLGQPWFDKPVLQGGVVYLACEAPGTIPPRRKAARDHRGNVVDEDGIFADTRDLPFVTIKEGADFSKDQGYQRLIPTLKKIASTFDEKYKVPLRLTIVDTMITAFAIENWNDPAQVTMVTNKLHDIAKQTGSAVMGIAHHGKDISRGVTGSFAQKANVDFLLSIYIKRANDNDPLSEVVSRHIHLSKYRDGPEGWQREFRLQSVPVGERGAD
jgi:hypothetical protein